MLNRDQHWQPISLLPQMARDLDEQLEGTNRAIRDFTAMLDHPHLLDDATIMDHKLAFTRDKAILPVLRNQIRRWEGEAKTEEDRTQIAHAGPVADQCIAGVDRVMKLLDELNKCTIDTIMGMTNAELGLASLLGTVKVPKPRR